MGLRTQFYLMHSHLLMQSFNLCKVVFILITKAGTLKLPWKSFTKNYVCTYLSKLRKCMGVNGEALQLHAVHKKLYSGIPI